MVWAASGRYACVYGGVILFDLFDTYVYIRFIISRTTDTLEVDCSKNVV